jgi:phosphoribosylformylglycinamidine synthase I
MRACVVVFPGSNADTEMIHALRGVCGVPTTVAWHTDTALPSGTDLVAIPGGFSYGDYLRTGAIAKVSPIVRAVKEHAARGGYVLGVCNGFQILAEAGLLAGALTRNLNQRFECGDWYVRVEGVGPFTRAAGEVWRLPVAHGEGRFQADAATLERLEGEGLVGLRYCTSGGAIEERANPNGSLRSIAGIYGGPRKNVFGLMPHPERMSEAFLGGADGKKLFDAVLAAA